jgi:hypothetical protein
VKAALEFRAPDVLPLRIYAAPGGLYEHGQKLADLIRACGHDFGDLSGVRLPEPPPAEDFDPDGRYHAIRTDAWGVTWEYRIFGVWGHPISWPLDDWAKLATWRPPALPAWDGPEVDAARAGCAAQQERYYCLGGAGSLFEVLDAVRPFEDALIDIAADEPEMIRLADIVLENMRAHVQRGLALDVDGIAVGDDFGTQQAPIFSPETWRRFFKPRYKALFDPIRRAGKPVFFHSCGQIGPILHDLKDVGAGVIWPQLPVFDLPDLAKRCRDIGLAIELHPDRGDLMQLGTPAEVRDYVLRILDIFDTTHGGSWLYIEIDPGFPWANVEALFKVAMELR